MKEEKEIRYYPGRGRKIEVIERGIVSELGTCARIRLSDGREELVVEEMLAYPLSASERKRNASE